jgi:hypothetical protein
MALKASVTQSARERVRIPRSSSGGRRFSRRVSRCARVSCWQLTAFGEGPLATDWRLLLHTGPLRAQ